VYGPIFLLTVVPFVGLPIPPVSCLLIFKTFMAAVHLANGWLVWRISTDAQPERRGINTVLYLLNPLMIWEAAGNGHVDFYAVFFLLAGIWADRRGRSRLAPLCLAAATMVKIYVAPVFLFYACARWSRTPREGRRRALVQTILIPFVVTLVLYLPFVHSIEALRAPFTGGGGRMVTNSWAVPLTEFYGVNRSAVIWGALGFMAAFALGGAVFALKSGRWLATSAWFVFLWACVGATWFQPWYAAMALALAVVASAPAARAGAIMLSVLAPACYFLQEHGLPLWIKREVVIILFTAQLVALTTALLMALIPRLEARLDRSVSS
jgi:hypothetical protein